MKQIALAVALVACTTSAHARYCDLARQIQGDYTASMTWGEEIGKRTAGQGDLFGFISSPRSVGVDSYSVDCLTCHDGSTVAGGEVRIYDHAGGNAIGKSHPIGTDYIDASFRRSGLVRIDRLDRRIVLIDGKIGCLSCHDMLNPGRFHLAVSTAGSGLCMACHSR